MDCHGHARGLRPGDQGRPSPGGAPGSGTATPAGHTVTWAASMVGAANKKAGEDEREHQLTHQLHGDAASSIRRTGEASPSELLGASPPPERTLVPHTPKKCSVWKTGRQH